VSLKNVIYEMYQGRTLIFGHRGASAYAPANTLTAFELAFQQGADGVELDVHQTNDREVVVIHDETIDATTDGIGFVRDMTLAQLKELDAGSYFGQRFAGTKIPTLDEVFAAVGDKLYINIEIKFFGVNSDGTERLVAEKIKHFGLKNRVIVSSFNPLVLIWFREIMPDVPLGYLFTSDLPTWPISTIKKLTYEATHPHYEVITNEFMETARAKSYVVNAWTVNDTERAVELHQIGVNGIITDKPDAILEAIRG